MPTKYLLLAALLFPAYAHASETQQCPLEELQDDEEDLNEPSFKAYDYVGIKAGTNHLVMPLFASPNSSAYGIYAGTRATKLFGVELDYTFLGTYSTAIGNAHSQAIGLFGVHQFDMGWISLVGKLGVASTHTVVPGQVAGNKIGFAYGAGIEVPFNKDLSLRMMWDTYKVSLPATTSDSVLSGALSYRF